jgi:signal transduction histidine kinase
MARRSRSIRFRITAIAVAVMTLLLVSVAVLIVALLRMQLTDNLDEGLHQRGDAIAALVAGSDNPQLPIDEDLLIQVVGPDGRVLLSSGNVDGALPIVSPSPGLSTIHDVPGYSDSFRVLVRPLTTPSDGRMLILAGNADDVSDTVSIMTLVLAITVPLVVALLGLLTWWLTGRTLRPVEQMRTEMADISASSLDRRIHQPGTDDEIDRLATTMNATLDRLEQAVRRQQRFVSDASHELRSPLTRIRSELEVDLAQPGEADFPATARNVLDETIGLQRLVDDLLALTHIDTGDAQGTRIEALDLDDVVLREVRRVRERGRVAINAGGVSAAHVAGDRNQLTRVVRNLLDNAERHADRTVTVTLAENDGHAALTVSNDGDRIDPDQRERVFDRFTRLDDSRSRDSGGTGLGLAIAREIVERHGGRIWIEPADRTVFVVQLPALR